MAKIFQRKPSWDDFLKDMNIEILLTSLEVR